MSSRQHQVQNQESNLQLGRRNDPAEARVNRRLEDPGIADLHHDALDPNQGRAAERTDLTPPPELDTMLASGGTPLPGALRHTMEGAFGESFADVRLHAGPEAGAAAAAMDNAAFATGQHIGIAPGAYRPDTPAGRGIIAHELAHVSEMRRGLDAPTAVRGVGFFESIGNFFQNLVGFEGFSDGELGQFIRELTRGEGETTLVSDNMARAIVSKGLHDRTQHAALEVEGTILAQAADLIVRRRLISHMLDGATLNGDEEAILTILRDATPLEREQLVHQIGEEVLFDKFQGAQLEELRLLILGGRNAAGEVVQGTAQTSAEPQTVNWELDYNIAGDSGITSSIKGLAVRQFNVIPDGQEATQIAENEFALDAPRPTAHPLGEMSHPKNTGGIGFMEVWMVPNDPTQRGLYREKTTRTLPLPDTSASDASQANGERYGQIPAADGQKVRAQVDVNVGSEQIGTATVSQARSVSFSETGGISQRDATRVNNTTSGSTESEQNFDSTIRRLDRLSAAVGLSAQSTRNFEVRRNWEISVQRAETELRQIDASFGGSTEEV
ncbi:MAG: DUF4157 domain-containing protein, partial [Pseudomonadota bacterium]